MFRYEQRLYGSVIFKTPLKFYNMRWTGRRQSSNVDDQRGSSGGGGGMLAKGGIGTIIVVLVVSFLTGKNPLTLLQQTGIDMTSTSTEQPYTPTAEEEELAAFVSVVLADTEDVWNQLMPNYREPTLVMFTNQVQSACGTATSSVGPFYCSADEKVYIDLGFYEDMRERFKAPGDFAQA
jgi:predicted metalloprotease